MARLAQLIPPYRPCAWDLKLDPAGREYWVRHFLEHLASILPLIEAEYPQASPARREAFARAYRVAYQHVAATPEDFERIDILMLDQLRQRLLVEYGFPDPYLGVKREANEAAARLLARLLAEVDGVGQAEQVGLLARGLMAGNIFDTGAQAAMEAYAESGADFWRLRDAQPARPWLRDGLDEWAGRVAAGEFRHLAVFVDNAGSDLTLGILPMVRWGLGWVERVTLVANSAPALNDVTAEELAAWLGRLAERELRGDVLGTAWRAGRVRVVASGSWAPLLDLEALDRACVEAIADADLIHLHGMGRAVESNSLARFSCASLRTASLKDPQVARFEGGRLFDCVFRFEPPAAGE